MLTLHLNLEDAEPLSAFVEGVVRNRVLVGADQSDELRVVFARFDAGARKLPHTHVLIKCC